MFWNMYVPTGLSVSTVLIDCCEVKVANYSNKQNNRAPAEWKFCINEASHPPESLSSSTRLTMNFRPGKCEVFTLNDQIIRYICLAVCLLLYLISQSHLSNLLDLDVADIQTGHQKLTIQIQKHYMMLSW